MALHGERLQEVRLGLTGRRPEALQSPAAPRRIGRVAVALSALALAVVASPHGVAAAAAPRYGSTLVFHGWSTDSRYVAYTRTRHRPPTRKGGAAPPAEVQRMHRQVLRGVFAGFGSQVGGDVAGWAKARGYRGADPVPRQRVSPRETAFLLPGPRELTLEVTVGDRIGWTLRDGDELIAEHVFDAIYVETDAELFVAPDRSQAVLVMHLSTGWVVDSAIYPVDLERADAAADEPTGVRLVRPAAAPVADTEQASPVR